jgi:hypothetical protein
MLLKCGILLLSPFSYNNTGCTEVKKNIFLGNAGLQELLYVPTTRKARNGYMRPHQMRLICVSYDQISGYRVPVKSGIFLSWGIRNF